MLQSPIYTMATDTIIIDKYAFIQRLETGGLTRQQAEGIADAVSGVALAQLASKVDLREAVSDLKIYILKFMFSAMAAQTALIVALIELLN